MIEDEQILIQNLSLTHQSPSSYSQTEQQLLLQQQQQSARDKNIITEICKQKQYYVDWNHHENHHYFTKNIVEDLQLQNYQLLSEKKQPKYQQRNQDYYENLVKQLEMALNRIQKNIQLKNSKKSGIRSQSIEPNKSRQIMMFSTTAREFRTEYTNQKKIANSRTKTQTEESEKDKNKGIHTKIQKYKMRHIITEQKEHSNIKECSKQNNLKNKFLASIALWQSKKEKKHLQRIQRQKKLSMQGVTFTPEINARSRQIMKKKGTVAPIYQREGKQKKTQLTQRFNVQHKAYRTKY